MALFRKVYQEYFVEKNNRIETETNENILKYCTATLIGDIYHIENAVCEILKVHNFQTSLTDIVHKNREEEINRIENAPNRPKELANIVERLRENDILLLAHQYVLGIEIEGLSRRSIFEFFTKAATKGLDILVRDSVCSKYCMLHNSIPEHLPSHVEKDYVVEGSNIRTIFDKALEMNFAHPTYLFYDKCLRMKQIHQIPALSLKAASKSLVSWKDFYPKGTFNFTRFRTDKEERRRNNELCFDVIFNNEILSYNRETTKEYYLDRAVSRHQSNEDFLETCSFVVNCLNTLNSANLDREKKLFYYLPTVWSFARNDLERHEIPDSTAEKKLELYAYILDKSTPYHKNFTYIHDTDKEYIDDMITTLTSDKWIAKWNLSIWKVLEVFHSEREVIRARDIFLEIGRKEIARQKKLKLSEEKRNRFQTSTLVLETKAPISSRENVIEVKVKVENVLTNTRAIVLCFLCSKEINEGYVKVKCAGKCSFSLHLNCWTVFIGNRERDVPCLNSNCKSKLCNWRYGSNITTLQITAKKMPNTSKAFIVELSSRPKEEESKVVPVYKGESYRQDSTKDYEKLSEDASINRLDKKLKEKLKRQKKQQKYEEEKQFNSLRLKEIFEEDEEPKPIESPVIEDDPPMILDFDRVIPDAVPEKPIVVEEEVKEEVRVVSKKKKRRKNKPVVEQPKPIILQTFVPVPMYYLILCNVCHKTGHPHINYPCGHVTSCQYCYSSNSMCTVCFGTIM